MDPLVTYWTFVPSYNSTILQIVIHVLPYYTDTTQNCFIEILSLNLSQLEQGPRNILFEQDY